MSRQIVSPACSRYPAFTFVNWKRDMDPEVARVVQESANAVSSGGGGGFLASVTTLLGVGVAYGGTVLAKKLGVFANSVGEANQAVQKDMLDWIQGQLESEVARREKAETQVQTLLDKLNEVTIQMTRMEAQNQSLQEQVQTLTGTVADLKSHIAGVVQT